jgi:YHS domain-containing protein
MDTEALKSLVWILVWGGLFFFMMRFGCGAHVMGHRHGGHGHEKGEGASGPQKDPVCGMEVNPKDAAGASVYRGRTYYFCSSSCRDKFEQAPGRYVGAPEQQQPQHGGHHG